MAKQVAVVKLAPGEIGYYDELSKVVLNVQCPTGIVYSDMNCSRLRQAIMNNQLELVTGTLIPVTTHFNEIDVIDKSLDKTPELIKPVETIVYAEEEQVAPAESKPKKKRKTPSKRKKKED